MKLSPRMNSRVMDWIWWFALLAFVTLLWCFAYHRWTREAWNTPVSYVGDSWGEMATAKTYATGDIYPIVQKYPASLGAPFRANWNDYPIVEEGLFTWFALFVRGFGVFLGSNLTLLSAHLLAAASFYFVCRHLRYEKMLSFAGAILFAMAPFAFARGLPHLVLTFYWHVPLGLLVAWWCVSGQATIERWRKPFCFGVSILYGIQYIYFTGMFCQFLLLAALVGLIRRDGWVRIGFPLILIGIEFATFILMNLDTFSYRLSHGQNPAALFRVYSGLELYALRPIELFLPAIHRFPGLQTWTNASYYSQTIFQRGENNSLYLGIVCIVALIWLAWSFLLAAARGRSAPLPWHGWGIGWILAFSVIGGLNGLLGVFGLILFRGSNRYSIVIAALALLFLIRELTRLTRKFRPLWIAGLATTITAVGLWDQIPPVPTKAQIHQVHQIIAADGRVAGSLESKLPGRAMIFNLPVAEYPETPPIVEMQDYEHFRPYLQTHSLRFSYGSQKGRSRERWQAELLQFGVPHAVKLLERYGFAAVLINKKGYADRAASLLAELRDMGRGEVLCETDDFVSVALHPAEHPPLPPEFDQSWHGLEGNATDHWRWSMGDAKLIIYNNDPAPRNVHLGFNLGTLRARTLELYARTNKLYAATLDPAQPPPRADLDVSLQPGRNEFHFRTDRPAEMPGNGDVRKLAFAIRNFELGN